MGQQHPMNVTGLPRRQDRQVHVPRSSCKTPFPAIGDTDVGKVLSDKNLHGLAFLVFPGLIERNGPESASHWHFFFFFYFCKIAAIVYLRLWISL